MRRAVIVVMWAFQCWACQEPSPPAPYVPEPPDTCDGHGNTCELQCCQLGYSCQRGFCLDAAFDMDLDGYIGYWDCDDYDRFVYPGAPELCDYHDNNCNGEVDEGIRDPDDGSCRAACEDRDGDGSRSCDEPPDCDDDDPAVHPEVEGDLPEEICDGKDNDCDGISDNGLDEDNDGVGRCAGYDCDDTNPAIATGFNEICDGLDNDCSGVADDGEVCGRLGTCEDGGCRWQFDAATNDVEHDDGYVGQPGEWCAGSKQAANFLMVRAPARGAGDFPFGLYIATFTIKVSNNTLSWGTCGTALRLRANDRSGDGTGTCRDCWFGGDVALVPAHFGSINTWEDHELNFSLGPDRQDHIIEVVALRGSCRDIEVCISEVTIVQQ